MTKTIWKYTLAIGDRNEVVMPDGGRILCVKTQRDWPCIWVLVDPYATKRPRVLRIYGTGHVVTDEERLRYLGTFLSDGDTFVWHVFEEVPEAQPAVPPQKG